MFGIATKRVVHELEAKLRSPDGGAGRGKVERKSYADGSGKLTVRMRSLDLPDGTALTMSFADRAVTTIEIAKGAGNFRLESGGGIALPAANDGETVRIQHGATIILIGDFRPD